MGLWLVYCDCNNMTNFLLASVQRMDGIMKIGGAIQELKSFVPKPNNKIITTLRIVMLVGYIM